MDIDVLHELLWDMAQGQGATRSIRIVQKDFCRQIRVERFSLCRLLGRMEGEGRIRSLTSVGGPRPKTYEVYDPALRAFA